MIWTQRSPRFAEWQLARIGELAGRSGEGQRRRNDCFGTLGFRRFLGQWFIKKGVRSVEKWSMKMDWEARLSQKVEVKH